MHRFRFSTHPLAVLFLLLTLCSIHPVQAAMAADQGPTFLLMKPEGLVELSKDGKKWRRLTRNKFLRPGYEIKTGVDGSAMLMNQVGGTTRNIGHGSHVRITVEGVTALSGSLSAPEKSHGALMASLSKRLKNGQLHSVVRRSKGSGKLKLRTAKRIVLSDDYPDLVWRNLGAEYSYRITVGDKSWEVAPGQKHPMRATLKEVAPGEHDYAVEVLKDGKVLYAPKRKGKLVWMTSDQRQKVTDDLARLEQFIPGDEMAKGSMLDEHGITVAAMDRYLAFLTQHPDANEMRPLLIEAYYNLKLSKLLQELSAKYNLAAYAEDGAEETP